MHIENLFATGRGKEAQNAGDGFQKWYRDRKQMHEEIRRGKRNWFLDMGIVFDVREPDLQGQHWDFRRRADRRFAWKAIAKEEPLMVVLG